LKDEFVYPFITDDGGAEQKLFSSKVFFQNEFYHVLMPNKFTAILIYPLNFITYDFHVSVLKEGRGQLAVDAVKKALAEYIFKKTPCRKIIIFVPDFNKSMIRFAHNIGAKIEGVIKNSFLKRGKLYDMQLFGLSKEV